MVLIRKEEIEKISKGYRLKKSTHKLIDKLQIMLKSNQDTVLAMACEMLYKEVNLNKMKKNYREEKIK